MTVSAPGSAAVGPAPSGSALDVQFAGAVLTQAQGDRIVDQYSATIGRVGPEVRSVVIHRADGVEVTTTVHNGWFAAWWSGDVRSLRFTVVRNDGTSYQLDAPSY